jgi:hypothetical protein
VKVIRIARYPLSPGIDLIGEEGGVANYANLRILDGKLWAEDSGLTGVLATYG